MKNCLADLGFKNISEADGGSAALDALKKGGVELVITDWNMPDMMGLDLWRAVRSDPGLSKTPFVIVSSAERQHELFEELCDATSAVVVTPLTRSALDGPLKKLLGSE